MEDMEAIAVNLNAAPTLSAIVDMKAKRAATRAFAKYFPSYEGLRHSGQHSGKLWGTPKRAKEHALPGGGRRVNNLIGRRFETTFKKKVISYELNAGSVSHLQEVKDLYMSAFAGVPHR
jgi:hypothetical protein